MHESRRIMQHRRRRVEELQERAPALINLPVPLPIGDIPIVGLLLTPIIDGKQKTTKTEPSPHSPTPPPQDPTPPQTTAPPQAPPSQPHTSAPSAPSTSGNTSSGNGGSGGSGGNGGNGGNGKGGNGNGNSHEDGNGNSSTPDNGQNPGPTTTQPPPSPTVSTPSAGSTGSPPSSGSSSNSSKGPSDSSNTETFPLTIARPGAFVTGSGTQSNNNPQETGNGVLTTDNGDADSGRSIAPTYTGHITGSIGGANTGPATSSNSPDPASPSGTVDATAATHRGPSTGVIAAISVIAALLFLVLLLCLLRRRAIAKRINRRKQWFIGSEAQYADKDTAASGNRSARSSFATSFDRGQLLTPAPALNFAAPSTLGEEMAQVWPSDLMGSITVPPASRTVDTVSSPTIRNAPDRSSIHSLSSSDSSSRRSSPDSQYLVAPPPAVSGSPLPSPFCVRPFSPSESWSFPKPPQDETGSRTASVSIRSKDAAAFFTLDEHQPQQTAGAGADKSEIENPFADFNAVALITAGTSANSVSNLTQPQFVPIETIRRPFVPSMDDEMSVRPGDEVRILNRFDDGWAVAEMVGNAGARQGLIPIDCLRAPEGDLPAFLANKRISSYRTLRESVLTARASVLSRGSSVGKAV